MLKMSMGVVTLFVICLAGFACTDRAGLDFPGSSGGQPGGGSGGAGSTSGLGGAIGSGGFFGGGVGGRQTGSGGNNGTGGCMALPCALPVCSHGFVLVPSSSPCGCDECVPLPNSGGGGAGAGGVVGAGGTKAGGTGGATSCPPVMCLLPACVGGEFKPNPNDPCGCPICVLNSPDAGPAKDAGLHDSGCLPVACPMLACINGYLPSPQPCGCPICAADGGTGTDDAKKDAPAGGSPDVHVCGPVCNIYCQYGNVVDSAGCLTCQCKPAPGCPTGSHAVTCPPDTTCALDCSEYQRGTDGCQLCACRTPATCAPPGGAACIYCPFGYRSGPGGCITCSCADPPIGCAVNSSDAGI
jgi:hypothetical protein